MQRKILLSHLLVILAMVLVVIISILGMVRGMLTENIISVTDQTMLRWGSELNSVMNYGKSYLLNLAINEDIQSLMKQARQASMRGQDESGNLAPEVDLLVESGELLYANRVVLNSIPFMVEICYLEPDGGLKSMYSTTRQNVSSDARYAPESEWVQALNAKAGQFLWSTSHDDASTYIRLSKIIYDTTTWTELGSMSVEFSFPHIATSVLNRMRMENGISAYVVDSATGTVLGYSGGGDELPYTAQLAGNTNYMNEEAGVYVVERQLAGSGYYLVGFKPMDEVENLVLNASRVLFFSATVAALVSLLVAMLYSHSLTKPLRKLSQTMKSVENGDLDITVTSQYKDEVGELYASFNYMISMVNTLIEENYVSQLNQKQSEINALEAQINTHFLYNTLDTINWLAKDYHADDISKLVTSLSSLLRISLNNGNPTLTVAQEIEHVRSYIDIQNIRFDNLFALKWTLDKTVMGEKIIKMLLQPLVENAITHGFDRPDRPREENLLEIVVQGEEQYLFLQVKSNGNVADYQKAQQLLEAPLGAERHSYGVLSIRSRLEVFYEGAAEYYYTPEDDGEMLAANIRIPRHYTRGEGDRQQEESDV